MRKKIIVLGLMGIFLLIQNAIFAQCSGRRANINTDFTPQERIELRNLIMDYLKSDIDNGNTDPVYKYTKVAIHSAYGTSFSNNWHSYDERFLTWHRVYIQGLEEYILKQGHPEYVPLPKWDPTYKIPDEFFNSQGSDNKNSVLVSGSSFLALQNQGPFTSSPTNFSRFKGNINCANWSNIDAYANDLEGGPHNQTHVAIGGSMGNTRTASGAAIFWLFHSYIDDLYYCYQQSCQGLDFDVYARDHEGDEGVEPSSATELWKSPDIWVRNQNDGFENYNSEGLCFKENIAGDIRPVYVYVRTWNRGPMASANNTVNIEAYWAQGSGGLSWPYPWDGSTNTTICDLKMGGKIGEQPLRSVNKAYDDVYDVDHDGDNTETLRGYTIYEFKWLPPNPDDYIDCFHDQDWHHRHFCIHARINDGTPLNLSGNFYDHLKNNNDLILRNIAIFGPQDANVVCDNITWLRKPGKPWRECIFFGNYTEKIMDNIGLKISFPTLADAELLNYANVIMELKDQAYVLWEEGGAIANEIIPNDVNQTIQFVKDKAGIEGLELPPYNIERLCIEIQPTPGTLALQELKDYTFDIIQTDGAKVINGERYVVSSKTLIDLYTQKSEFDAIQKRSPLMEEDHSLVSIFPNPANQQFTINIEGNDHSHHISITNVLGELIYETNNVVGSKTIHVADLEKGLLIIEIVNTTTGDVQTEKLLIQ